MNTLARSPHQIGSVICRARRNSSLSQRELGERAGVRQETISLIENGSPGTKIETLLAILAALKLEFRITDRSSAANWNV